MRKIHLFVSATILFLSANVRSQEKKGSKSTPITPYAEILYGVGVCGTDNPFSFMAGIEKPVAKHWTFSTDIHIWKTDYEIYCCDVFSKGSYSSVIPSVKIRFDPGKRNKGIFVGAGIGYVIAKDRGTEQPYVYNPGIGTTTLGKEITTGNWDYHGIAPSFNMGLGFKIKRFPIAIVSEYYFAKTPWGWGPVATGIGLKLGLKQVKSKGCERKEKTKGCERTKKCS